MKCRNYILNAHGEPQLCKELEEWAYWFESRPKDRIVKQEWVGNVKISTVFLAIDHQHNSKGPPVLWESMTFSNSKKFQFGDRCSGGREQAEAMHQKMVKLVRKVLLNK